MTYHRIRLINGPHHGLTVSYPALPAVLVMLDAEFCYHEYTRSAVVGRYVWRRALGRPAWAAQAVAMREVERLRKTPHP